MNGLQVFLSIAKIIPRSIFEERLGFITLWPRVANSVPGWCSGPDARLLFAFAHHGPGHGAIVEIGSAWGRSTVFLARGSKLAKREKVFSIDPHTGDPFFICGKKPQGPKLENSEYKVDDGTEFNSYSGFLRTIRHFQIEDWVIPLVMTSNEATKKTEIGPIRLLFIDGMHTYEAVKDDINNWVPRVISGGVIVFDDYDNFTSGVGVKRAVDELLTSGLVDSALSRGRWHVWTTKK